MFNKNKAAQLLISFKYTQKDILNYNKILQYYCFVFVIR